MNCHLLLRLNALQWEKQSSRQFAKNLLVWEGMHLLSPLQILKWKAEVVRRLLTCQSDRTTASRSIFKGRLFSVWREGIHPPTCAPSGWDQKSQTVTVGLERAFSTFRKIKQNTSLYANLPFTNLKKLNILKTKEKTFGQLKRETQTAVFWKKTQH